MSKKSQTKEARRDTVMGKQLTEKRLRPTLFDALGSSRNLLCASSDLSNEASVETFFVARLLTDVLSYRDSQIQTKQTLERLMVGRGHRRERYRPDYALKVSKRVRCIIDAKGTDEDIDDWIEQHLEAA